MSLGGPPQDGDGDLAGVLDRIRAGDEDAARELLRRYEAEVRLVVRRQLPRLLRSRFDSLDFLQSVWGDFFQRVRTGPAEFQDSRHLVGFLARAAKNKVIDQYRRAASQKGDMHREEPIFSDAGQPRDLEDGGDSPSALAVEATHQSTSPSSSASVAASSDRPWYTCFLTWARTSPASSAMPDAASSTLSRSLSRGFIVRAAATWYSSSVIARSSSRVM